MIRWTGTCESERVRVRVRMRIKVRVKERVRVRVLGFGVWGTRTCEESATGCHSAAACSGVGCRV